MHHEVNTTKAMRTCAMHSARALIPIPLEIVAPAAPELSPFKTVGSFFLFSDTGGSRHRRVKARTTTSFRFLIFTVFFILSMEKDPCGRAVNF